MEPLLRFSEVELYYDHVYALKGVSVDLAPGETVALIGANGAGKSSILRAITGLRRIKSGSIHFDGRRIDARAPPISCAWESQWSRKVGAYFPTCRSKTTS